MNKLKLAIIVFLSLVSAFFIFGIASYFFLQVYTPKYQDYKYELPDYAYLANGKAKKINVSWFYYNSTQMVLYKEAICDFNTNPPLLFHSKEMDKDGKLLKEIWFLSENGETTYNFVTQDNVNDSVSAYKLKEEDKRKHLSYFYRTIKKNSIELFTDVISIAYTDSSIVKQTVTDVAVMPIEKIVFDHRGNKTNHYFYDNGSVLIQDNYGYDYEGKPVYYSSTNVRTDVTNEYWQISTKSDEKGNWVEQTIHKATTQDKNGPDLIVIKRVIEYR